MNDAPQTAETGVVEDRSEREREAAEPSASEPEQPAIEEFGFGEPDQAHSDPFLTYAVVLRNPNESRWIAERVDVAITWTDDDGSVVGRDTGLVHVILPDEVGVVTGRTFDLDATSVTSMEVQARVDSWVDAGEGPFGALEISDVNLHESNVTARVSSTFDRELTDLDAHAIFRDSDGDIVGGWGYAGVEFIAPGGETSVEVNRPTGLEAHSAEAFVQLTWSSLRD